MSGFSPDPFLEDFEDEDMDCPLGLSNYIADGVSFAGGILHASSGYDTYVSYDSDPDKFYGIGGTMIMEGSVNDEVRTLWLDTEDCSAFLFFDVAGAGTMAMKVRIYTSASTFNEYDCGVTLNIGQWYRLTMFACYSKKMLYVCVDDVIRWQHSFDPPYYGSTPDGMYYTRNAVDGATLRWDDIFVSTKAYCKALKKKLYGRNSLSLALPHYNPIRVLEGLNVG